MTTDTLTSLDPSGADVGPRVGVAPGPRLLRYVDGDTSFAAHLDRVGAVPPLSRRELQDATDQVALRGRGGAGFPFARKLEAVGSTSGAATVVVNVSEGEPASFKDATLALLAPHRVLDGAAACARALGVHTVHLVVPAEHPAVEQSLRRAVAERTRDPRRSRRLRWRLHRASPWFVAGQARAVIELMSGRANLPVTGWRPEAYTGYRGRPTLLSNAETYAHVGEIARQGAEGYAGLGTPDEPGTALLTLRGDTDSPRVVEVAYGTPWDEVLAEDELDGPVLIGGYHGSWAVAGELAGTRVSRSALQGAGLTLGAGVVLPVRDCPLRRTRDVVGYLAGQSAGRCGPCRNGLPALADALGDLDAGRPGTQRAQQLMRLVTGRGACAHPDGTARLVASLLRGWPDEPAVHARGGCSVVPS